jgi:hypothetical protein
MLRDLKANSSKLIGKSPTTDSRIQEYSGLETFDHDAEFIDLCCQIAMVGVLSGKRLEVERILRFLNEVLPLNIKVRLTTAYSLTISGYANEAIELLRKLKGEHPASVFTACMLNYFELVRGDHSNAETLIAASKSSEKDVQTFSVKGLAVLRKMGRNV